MARPFPARHRQRFGPDPAPEFAERAHRYWMWDRKLATCTRFFGAAALTNEVIACGLARPARSLLLTDASLELLSALSYRLAIYNERLAADVLNSRTALGELDRRLVFLEQSRVEKQLACWRRTGQEGVRTFLTQMDRLLRYAAHANSDAEPAMVMYLTAIRHLSDATGRPLRFYDQEDRIRVGQQLIVVLRDNAGQQSI